MDSFFKKLAAVTTLTACAMAFTARSQSFPVNIVGNGDNVYVNSTDVDSYGNIYITGSTAPFTGTSFCSDPYFFSNSVSYTRIFAAKIDPVSQTMLWFVSSTSQPGGETFAGNDIEVDSEGNAYVVGTVNGSATFTKLGGGSVSTCANGSRHFIMRIDADGDPAWISETQSIIPSYGEGLTLDEENGRLHTGGYLGQVSDTPVMVYFPDADCTGGCSFAASAGGSPSPNVGFVSTYQMSNGDNTGANQIAERVMALAVDKTTSTDVWITGSRHEIGDPDRNVLLAKLQMNMTMCAPLTIDYSIPIADFGGIYGGDMGWDIASTWAGRAVFTGTFTRNCFFPGPGGGVLTSGSTTSEHFIASWNKSTLSWDGVKTTSSVGPATNNNDYYLQRHICVATPEVPSEKVIIGYDRHVNTNGTSAVSGSIISREMYTNLDTTGLGITQFSVNLPPAPLGSYYTTTQQARAMEIVYDEATPRRYLAGDYSANLSIGSCFLPGGGSDKAGYVARINASHTAFSKQEDEKGQLQRVDENAGMSVFPNPSKGSFTISGLSEIGATEITVFSLQGALIARETVINDRMQLDLSSFGSGMYMMNIQTNTGLQTEKLLIE